jgi:hypothetical protein
LGLHHHMKNSQWTTQLEWYCRRCSQPVVSCGCNNTLHRIQYSKDYFLIDCVRVSILSFSTSNRSNECVSSKFSCHLWQGESAAAMRFALNRACCTACPPIGRSAMLLHHRGFITRLLFVWNPNVRRQIGFWLSCYMCCYCLRPMRGPCSFAC